MFIVLRLPTYTIDLPIDWLYHALIGVYPNIILQLLAQAISDIISVPPPYSASLVLLPYFVKLYDPFTMKIINKVYSIFGKTWKTNSGIIFYFIYFEGTNRSHTQSHLVHNNE